MIRRLMLLTPTALLTFALLAPTAAMAHDGGQGLLGETTDLTVTKAGFILIAAFPLFILMMSLLQWRLDKRKYARKAAAKNRASNAVWKGGW